MTGPRTVLTALCLTAAGMAAAQTDGLNTLRDRAWVLLVFGDPHDDRVARQFQQLASHRSQAAERNLLMVPLTGPPPAPSAQKDALLVPFPPAEQRRLRQRFHVAPGSFTVLLIGKDGGEKVRSHAPIAWQELAGAIDAMPMRQQEMQRQ